jgi:SAM-dependent MidA family methyltransferase
MYLELEYNRVKLQLEELGASRRQQQLLQQRPDMLLSLFHVVWPLLLPSMLHLTIVSPELLEALAVF